MNEGKILYAMFYRQVKRRLSPCHEESTPLRSEIGSPEQLMLPDLRKEGGMVA